MQTTPVFSQSGKCCATVFPPVQVIRLTHGNLLTDTRKLPSQETTCFSRLKLNHKEQETHFRKFTSWLPSVISCSNNHLVHNVCCPHSCFKLHLNSINKDSKLLVLRFFFHLRPAAPRNINIPALYVQVKELDFSPTAKAGFESWSWGSWSAHNWHLVAD